jgi:glycosyltransferase involved in cell wall biosynthesis
VKIRTHHVLRLLAREFEVDALCFHRRSTRQGGDDVEESVAALHEFADSVEAFAIPQERSRARFVWDHLRSVVRRRPYTVFSYESADFLSRLQEMLAAKTYDIVHVDSLDLSRYLPELQDVPVVCAHHNVESELLRRRGDSADLPPERAYLRLQADLLAREEERWCPEVDLNVTVSDRDRRALEDRIPDAEYLVVPNGVDTDEFRPSGPGEGGAESGIVFVGGCTWFPNRDALEHFAEDVLPLVRERHPDVTVRWVGRADEATRRRYCGEHGIRMTGYVEDIRPHVHEAACYVVPIRVGGGTRLKILDAWAMGKAVVSTSQGCEGLEARDGENILIRDSAEEFAAAVDRVLTDADLRERLGRNARATAEETYSWEVIGDEMTEIYRKLAVSGERSEAGHDVPVGG